MRQIISWKLFNNSDCVLANENANSIYTDDKIIYVDDYGKHTIDINNKIYHRESVDNTMKIDFKYKICTFKFKKEGELSFEIECSLICDANKVVITYNIDEDKKRIEIERKE